MIYDSVDGKPNRRIAFITTDGQGLILSSTVSKNPVATDRTGSTLIVDDYVAEQITKFRFINGELVLNDGEELIVPVKSEKELQREALLKQLAELESQPDEPTDTEELAETPLLDYTDEPTD